MRNILCNIINPLSDQQAEFLPNQIISIEADKIIAITPRKDFVGNELEDYSHCLALPGFIDLHVHLSQYRMRGKFEPALLPWLEKHVFPEEARSADMSYATELARMFYKALYQAGTTFAVIYTAPFVSACEAAFRVAAEMGVKALIGMTMMDMNTPVALLQDSQQSLGTSIGLFERWHGQKPDLDYIFTPRFAPTCSFELMQRTGDYATRHKAWIQTHLSENTSEIAWVKELFGFESYTEVYAEAGLLTERSLFGHAIHLNDRELGLLKAADAKIAHCPDSNFFLKSGEFPLSRIEEIGLEYGLGSDVGAGTTLSMLYHAKQMNYRQGLFPVSPAKALYHITLGSAKLLGMENQIGSLQPGKAADLLLFSTPPGFDPGPDSLSQLIFFASEFPVEEVIVNGKSRL